MRLRIITFLFLTKLVKNKVRENKNQEIRKVMPNTIGYAIHNDEVIVSFKEYF